MKFLFDTANKALGNGLGTVIVYTVLVAVVTTAFLYIKNGISNFMGRELNDLYLLVTNYVVYVPVLFVTILAIAYKMLNRRGK